MSTSQIKDVADAQAIAREFVIKHGLQTNGALDLARSWFNGGNVSDSWRATLTVDNLNAKLASAFLVQSGD